MTTENLLLAEAEELKSQGNDAFRKVSGYVCCAFVLKIDDAS
jgi:hypothetical protein